MGNNLPTPPTKNKLDDHLFIEPISQGRNLMRHKITGKYITTVEHTFPSEELMNDYVRKNKSNMALQHQFYLNAHDYEILSQTNMCSKQYKIIEYFQHQNHTIQKQIEGRMYSNKPFTNKQIMSILCSVVLAMSHISKLQLLHYTLNPDDIVIDQHGICKVICSNISKHQFDFNVDKTFYYAPQTLKIFKLQTANNTITNKSAVFTLGMTLLTMAHLSHLHQVYNFNTFTLNIQDINQLTNMINDQDLRTILMKMLKYHSYERITFTQLQQMLYQIISQDELKGQKSSSCLENQQYQLTKLQQSIVRIKQSQCRYDQQPTFSCIHHVQFSYNSPIDTLPVHFFSQALGSMEADQQDWPTFDHSALPNTEQDPVVLDQDDKKTQDFLSRRQSLASSQSQAQLNAFMQLNDYNRKTPLMENLNISNISQQPKISHPNHCSYEMLYLKQNQGDFFSSTKKQKNENQPQYVTQFFKEGKYEGYKVDKYRNGFGTFYYNQGGKYCGEWFKNRMQGRGVLYYSNGKLAYEGQWKDDKLCGYGVLYNQKIQSLEQSYDFSHLQRLSSQWVKYQGYFQNDLRNGQGTLFLTNGQFFRGTFENDLPHGPGQFKNIRGDVIKGLWLMGALNQLS